MSQNRSIRLERKFVLPKTASRLNSMVFTDAVVLTFVVLLYVPYFLAYTLLYNEIPESVAGPIILFLAISGNYFANYFSIKLCNNELVTVTIFESSFNRAQESGRVIHSKRPIHVYLTLSIITLLAIGGVLIAVKQMNLGRTGMAMLLIILFAFVITLFKMSRFLQRSYTVNNGEITILGLFGPKITIFPRKLYLIHGYRLTSGDRIIVSLGLRKFTLAAARDCGDIRALFDELRAGTGILSIEIVGLPVPVYPRLREFGTANEQ